MLLLAIDASSPTVTLALGEGDPGARKLLGELEIPPGVNASTRLPQAFVELLDAAQRKLADLGAIVVGTGPGSLTGLRVAQASAKGIAYARRIPLLGISSLEALAHDAPVDESALCVPLMDARRGEVYAGLFRRRARGVEVLEPAIAITAEALAAKLRDAGELRIFGPGEPLVREALSKAGVTYLADGPAFPRARALLELAPAPPPFDARALFALEPRYVRAPESEWTIKPKKAK